MIKSLLVVYIKEPFEFTPQFKLICMCNDLPHIPSNDDGTWRRLEVVDFIARFVDYETEVDEGKHRYLGTKVSKIRFQCGLSFLNDYFTALEGV